MDPEQQRNYDEYRAMQVKMVKAYSAVRRAVKAGKIKSPVNCSRCGAAAKPKGIEGYSPAVSIRFHHTHGYEKEHHFTGIWVCNRCHMRLHQGCPIMPETWVVTDVFSRGHNKHFTLLRSKRVEIEFDAEVAQHVTLVHEVSEWVKEDREKDAKLEAQTARAERLKTALLTILEDPAARILPPSLLRKVKEAVES